MSANDINIMNVTQANPHDVAIWASQNLLDRRLPEPGPNTAVSTTHAEAYTLIAAIPNKIALATELYGVTTAALANQKIAKKLATENKMDVESTIAILGATQDILYRCIQTLHVQYEGASRLMTAMAAQDRMGRGGA